MVKCIIRYLSSGEYFTAITWTVVSLYSSWIMYFICGIKKGLIFPIFMSGLQRSEKRLRAEVRRIFSFLITSIDQHVSLPNMFSMSIPPLLLSLGSEYPQGQNAS
jgi:hypothetical protein